MLARALDADYEVICESGNGLIMTDGGACASFLGGAGNCIPDKWKHRLACALDSCRDLTAGMEAPAPWAPDAVLINLGQNDYGAPAHVDPKTGKHKRSDSIVEMYTGSKFQDELARLQGKVPPSLAAEPPAIIEDGGGEEEAPS